jgi:hypothetical protein
MAGMALANAPGIAKPAAGGTFWATTLEIAQFAARPFACWFGPVGRVE